MQLASCPKYSFIPLVSEPALNRLRELGLNYLAQPLGTWLILFQKATLSLISRKLLWSKGIRLTYVMCSSRRSTDGNSRLQWGQETWTLSEADFDVDDLDRLLGEVWRKHFQLLNCAVLIGNGLNNAFELMLLDWIKALLLKKLCVNNNLLEISMIYIKSLTKLVANAARLSRVKLEFTWKNESPN